MPVALISSTAEINNVLVSLIVICLSLIHIYLHIPVDNIVQDWNYWKLDSWGSHEFEAARYPNPQAMLDLSLIHIYLIICLAVLRHYYQTLFVTETLFGCSLNTDNLIASRW